jgi:hypothetical protein
MTRSRRPSPALRCVSNEPPGSAIATATRGTNSQTRVLLLVLGGSLAITAAHVAEREYVGSGASIGSTAASAGEAAISPTRTATCRDASFSMVSAVVVRTVVLHFGAEAIATTVSAGAALAASPAPANDRSCSLLLAAEGEPRHGSGGVGQRLGKPSTDAQVRSSLVGEPESARWTAWLDRLRGARVPAVRLYSWALAPGGGHEWWRVVVRSVGGQG